MYGLDSSGSGYGPTAGLCDKLSGSMKTEKFLICKVIVMEQRI